MSDAIVHQGGMLIRKLQSYATRTVVPDFDLFFDAITRLNGSGKSNILDSKCSVLGITNLHQIRASNLQELVIRSHDSHGSNFRGAFAESCNLQVLVVNMIIHEGELQPSNCGWWKDQELKGGVAIDNGALDGTGARVDTDWKSLLLNEGMRDFA